MAAAKRRIHADLLEMRLYNDDVRALLRAQGSLLRHNGAYLWLSLRAAASSRRCRSRWPSRRCRAGTATPASCRVSPRSSPPTCAARPRPCCPRSTLLARLEASYRRRTGHVLPVAAAGRVAGGATRAGAHVLRVQPAGAPPSRRPCYVGQRSSAPLAARARAGPRDAAPLSVRGARARRLADRRHPRGLPGALLAPCSASRCTGSWSTLPPASPSCSRSGSRSAW